MCILDRFRPRPTEVRLDESMLEEFKKAVRIGKAGTPELVRIEDFAPARASRFNP